MIQLLLLLLLSTAFNSNRITLSHKTVTHMPVTFSFASTKHEKIPHLIIFINFYLFFIQTLILIYYTVYCVGTHLSDNNNINCIKTTI